MTHKIPEREITMEMVLAQYEHEVEYRSRKSIQQALEVLEEAIITGNEYFGGRDTAILGMKLGELKTIRAICKGKHLMDKTQQAIEALDEAIECFQPETLEKLREYFPVLRQALEQTQWQPIETAPKDGSVFLGCSTEHGFLSVMKWTGHGFGDGVFPIMYPTHWQPLPELPQPEKNK